MMQFAENALRDRRGETEEDTFMNNATEKFKDMISGGGDCQSDNDCTPYLGHCVINPEPVRKGACTGLGKSTNPRFREQDYKNLRSPVCSRQKSATFPPHFLGTLSLWICRSLYSGFPIPSWARL